MSVDEKSPRTGIDRRSALKKAAIAGTVAWTAPAILSETAHAVDFVGPCTAKCAPSPTISVQPNTGLFCNTNGQKWAQLIYTVTGIVCPCQAGGATASVLGANANPNPAEVKSVGFDPATNVGNVIIGGSGQGALGNGSYQVAINFCVQCNDRSNPPDIIRRLCTTVINFTFQPADGPCSQGINVGAAQLVGTTCQGPECAICPAPA